MLRIVVLRCPTLYLRWTASGTCCATLLQRCKQAAWRHLEAANCRVFRHRWKTLDSGLATLASVWTTLCNVGESITLLDHVVQRCAALHNLWQRCIIAGERWTAFVQRCYNVAKKLPNVISYAGTMYILFNKLVFGNTDLEFLFFSKTLSQSCRKIKIYYLLLNTKQITKIRLEMRRLIQKTIS